MDKENHTISITIINCFGASTELPDLKEQISTAVREVQSCLQPQRHPSALKQQQQQQKSIAIVPPPSPSPQKRCTFHPGSFGVTIAKVLYDLNAFDGDHAVSEQKIIENGSMIDQRELSSNPGSSRMKFAGNVVRAMRKLMKNKLISESINGYFLTQSGRREYETKVLNSGKNNRRDSNGPVIDCSRRQQDEYLDAGSNNNDNSVDNGRRVESTNTHKLEDKLFVLALYHLSVNSHSTSGTPGYTKAEIQRQAAMIKSQYHMIHFNNSEEVLAKNESDGLITVCDGRYKLTWKGEGVANDAAANLTIEITTPPRKRQRILF